MVQSITACFALDIDWTAVAAIATFTAAAVALYVGLKPMRIAKVARERVAKSALKLLLAEASEQSYQLGVATRFMSGKQISPAGYAMALNFANRIDDKPFRDMIPYMDALPEDVSEEITAAAVVIGTNIKLLRHIGTIRGPGGHVAPMVASLKQVSEHLESFREVAGNYLGYPRVNRPEQQDELAATIDEVSSSRKP